MDRLYRKLSEHGKFRESVHCKYYSTNSLWQWLKVYMYPQIDNAFWIALRSTYNLNLGSQNSWRHSQNRRV